MMLQGLEKSAIAFLWVVFFAGVAMTGAVYGLFRLVAWIAHHLQWN